MQLNYQRFLGLASLWVLCAQAGCQPVDESGASAHSDDVKQYQMPGEEGPHQGTWLQWPHDYGYDPDHVQRYEPIWIAITEALHLGEEVYIVAYNDAERNRIESLLTERGLYMDRIQFFIFRTDDVWVRDNGPVYVFDEQDDLVITDWKFNGWGFKADYRHCDKIPALIHMATGVPMVEVSMVNEGGSIELDGNGTLMAKRSSILNRNRNRGWSQADAEACFKRYLGVEHFIWLDGQAGLEITDDHIDGTARFAHGNTIVTYSRADSAPGEYEILEAATDKNGQPYQIVELPITAHEIPGAGWEGTYLNYYVGNEVVLVPNFSDAADTEANAIIQVLYPDRTVIGIDVTELYKDGGAIHCVTQQVPALR